MFAMLYSSADFNDEKYESLKSCDLYKSGCTFVASSVTDKFKWYNAYDIPDSGADSAISN